MKKKKINIEDTVVTRVIKEVEFITQDDWLDIQQCVELGYVQTKDYALHKIAGRLLKEFFPEKRSRNVKTR